mgnify:FL=1
MTPQELKNSILQLAIQGKLVEQRPEEGTAEELFKKIQEEKQRLIAEKKIKKEKPLPEITEDEKPFEIPESWMWVRVGSCGSWGSGATPSRTNSEYYGGTIPWLKTGDLNDGIITEIPEYITELALEKTSVRLNPIGSVLMAMYGATIGKLGILGIEATTNQACCACIPYEGIYNKFLFYFLMASRTAFIKMGEGGAQPNISKEKIVNALFPLPPLSEQKRIVAKIEELLPYIDRYEQAWSKLEQFNSRFPEDMKKSLLQYAIQGKLVEQRPEEGTAEELFAQIQEKKQRLIAEKKIKKEKPLPEITDDEKPFDIPESWKWVKISDVIDVRDGTHDTPKYVLKGIPLVTSKNLVSGKIDFDTAKLISEEDAAAINMRSEVNTGDILFAMIGTIGNPVLVKKDREFCIKNMALFKPIDNHLFDMSYLLLFLQKEQEQMKKSASGGVQLFVSLKFLRNYLLPLPPLSEQKRIVEKLEQLLPLCERLK